MEQPVLSFVIQVSNGDSFSSSEAGTLPVNSEPLDLVEAIQASAWALIRDYKVTLES